MIRKLLIQASVPKGNATLVGNYYDKKTRKNLYLVDGGKRVCTDNDYEDEKIHNVLISDGQVHTHEYDDAIKSELAVVDFYKNHPLCRTVGSTNPNMVNALFTIVIHHEVVEKDIFELDRNLDIAIETLKLSFEEKYELAFALGLDPRGMTHKDLVIALIGPNLLGKAVTEHESFDLYMRGVESDRKAKVYANKAILAGIIPFTDGYYRVAGRTLGATQRDVVDLCVTDKEFFYSFVVPEVDKLHTAPTAKQDDYKPSKDFNKLADIPKTIDENYKEIKKQGRGKKDALISEMIETE